MSVERDRAGVILGSLPVGERVGIAFSGGLDTSCALAWMREHGAMPYAFTADLGQYDEPDIAAVPAKALAFGAEDAVLVDCKEALAREGLTALQCGAFHIQTAGKRYFNTTPLGRAVTGTKLVQAMAEHGVDIWGDGSTYKGNDIQRFYRYGLLVNEHLRIYKPWLDSAFVEELGGRTRDERVAARARPAARGVRRQGVLHRREHARRDARGEGSRAARDVDEDRRADHGRRALGPRRRDRARGGDDRVRGRPARSRSAAARSTIRSSWSRAANEIGGRHGLGMSDQIENRVIEAKSRGIYEAPGMALLHIAYERLLTAIHNEGDDRALRRGRAPARPPALRGPLVRRAGADAARRAAALGRGRRRPAR